MEKTLSAHVVCNGGRVYLDVEALAKGEVKLEKGTLGELCECGCDPFDPNSKEDHWEILGAIVQSFCGLQFPVIRRRVSGLSVGE